MYVGGGGDVFLANDTYHSVMGGNGFVVVGATGNVEVDNDAGLTAGLTEDGVHIDGVNSSEEWFDAVAVYNRDSGIIVGNWDGIYINNVQGSYTGDVLVDNAQYWDNGIEDFVPGGFIAGVNGDGVAIYNVDGDVTILNGGTRGDGINFETITEDGIDTRGYSASEYVLRMTRDEIGSYLGLKLETVSRLLSRMHRDGLIQVQGRTIKLIDPVGLKTLVETGH